MKAIQVKVLPTTATKPTRIKAWIDGPGGSFKNIVTRDYELSEYYQARVVAEEMCNIMHWRVHLIGGQLPGGDYAFCIQPPTQPRSGGSDE